MTVVNPDAARKKARLPIDCEVTANLPCLVISEPLPYLPARVWRPYATDSILIYLSVSLPEKPLSKIASKVPQVLREDPESAQP